MIIQTIVLLIVVMMTSVQAYADQDPVKVIENFVISATSKNERETPDIPPEVTQVLHELNTKNRHDHLPFLVEYGLRLHLQFLQQSGLSRELPIEHNSMNAALVQELHLKKFTTAHEGGWLNRQFDGEFTWQSYSSYQVYVWMLETNEATLDWANVDRIHDLMEAIQQTGIHGLGGNGTCHYGCR